MIFMWYTAWLQYVDSGKLEKTWSLLSLSFYTFKAHGPDSTVINLLWIDFSPKFSLQEKPRQSKMAITWMLAGHKVRSLFDHLGVHELWRCRKRGREGTKFCPTFPNPHTGVMQYHMKISGIWSWTAGTVQKVILVTINSKSKQLFWS